MKEKLLTYLASNRLMSVLFIAFPTAMGIGTFLETWYSTDAAKIWVYNAWWFELMMVFFVFNFIGNMFKYKLFRKEKWAVLSIHLSFILILFGAFITRYIGYEGVMPIREGESTNIFLSEKTYLEILVDGEFEGSALRKPITKQLLLSEHVDHDFVISDEFKDQDFSINFVDYLENATEGLVLDSEGDRYLKIVEASDGNRHDHYIKEGEVVNIHNLLFTLNNPIDGATNIQAIDGEYFVSSPFEGTFMRMADQFEGNLVKDSIQPLQLRSLYELPNFQFVIPEPVLRGKFDIVKADEDIDLKQIKKLLTRAQKEVHSTPNRVRYTMNNYIIAVGSFIESLSIDALKIAEKVGKVEVEMGGTSCKVPLAADYIRKTTDKGGVRKKKKTARC